MKVRNVLLGGAVVASLAAPAVAATQPTATATATATGSAARAGVWVEPITGRTATPVTPVEAVTISEQLARHAPPLPAGVAALVQRSAPKAPPAAVRTGAAAAAAGAGDDHPEGTGCDAQFHHGDEDRNGNGTIEPWEQTPHANETCEVIYVWDEGTVEQRIETVTQDLSDLYGGLYDREVGRTYSRVAARELSSATGHHHDVCASTGEEITAEQWARGLELVTETRDFLDQYENNPILLRQHGYWPYPVPGTKTFHWFNSGLATETANGTNYYGDTDPETDAEKWRAEGQQRVIDPEAQEMFTMALTDDGYVADNVAYVYVYDGPEDPFTIDANKPGSRPGVDGDNEGLGCLLMWHGHTEGAEGVATGNTDGRTWMAHLWFYGGLYPFGDGDLDGSEPHGWFTPLNGVPAFCNHGGGCI